MRSTEKRNTIEPKPHPMNTQTLESRPGFLIRHPWLLIVLAFVLLLGAWSTLITIAVKNSPQQVEVKR